MEFAAWKGFKGGHWQQEIDLRDFIQQNYTPYLGDEGFLTPATDRTKSLMHKLEGLFRLEQEFGGVLDVDTQTVSSLTAYKPGYLDKEKEILWAFRPTGPSSGGSTPSAAFA